MPLKNVQCRLDRVTAKGITQGFTMGESQKDEMHLEKKRSTQSFPREKKLGTKGKGGGEKRLDRAYCFTGASLTWKWKKFYFAVK